MNHIQEALRQVIQGGDFDSPKALLKTVKADVAVKLAPGLPYSIATNVAHADIWNRQWVGRLDGKPKSNPFPDFPVIKEKDWPKIRDQFLATLDRAYEIASAEPFTHHSKTDESAERTLLKVAIHTSYHLGQIKLLKRALRTSKSP